MCNIRRSALGATQNPKTSADIDLSDDVLNLPDGAIFLLLDLTFEDGKRCMVFSGKEGQNLLKSKSNFFLDGTFKSCPRQFKQLHTIYADVSSTEQSHIYMTPPIFIRNKLFVSLPNQLFSWQNIHKTNGIITADNCLWEWLRQLYLQNFIQNLSEK